MRSIAVFQDRPVVGAPMGTFSDLSAQWTALGKLLPQPPEVMEGAGSALPPGFGWSQRSKGVLQMPGGYSGYLVSLKKVCHWSPTNGQRQPN